MKIHPAVFADFDRLNLWLLKKVLKINPSRLYSHRGVKIFDPLDISFFVFDEDYSRLYVREVDIPLVVSYLKLRDSGISKTRINGFQLPWSDFIFLTEQAVLANCSIENLLQSLISKWRMEQAERIKDENSENS